MASGTSHFLFVGLNKGIGPNKELKVAQDDARDLCNQLQRLNPVGAKLVPKIGAQCTVGAIKAELTTIQNLVGCDLLVVYWAGHIIKDGANAYLVTANAETSLQFDQLIHLQELLTPFATSKVKKRVLILDACYSEEAKDIYSKIADTFDGPTYILAACGRDQTAREGPEHGLLTGCILKKLLLPGATSELKLGRVLDEAFDSFPAKPDQKPAPLRWGDYASITIRLAPPAGPTSSASPNIDPLEQALGYATQAFREYLEHHVIKNVEVIYFLSYDIWDGYLLYDGLVSESTEQMLLDAIRGAFLDVGHLHSRYERLVHEADSDSTPSELGSAGRCFYEAVKGAQDPLDKKSPVERLWYIGDLATSSYQSEFEEYDRLLGLRCCLYIPVLNPRVSKTRDGAEGKRPQGGVLMAANRSPYGLEPIGSVARDRWEDARQRFAGKSSAASGTPSAPGAVTPNAIIEAHKSISREIVAGLRDDARLSADGKVSDFDIFLNCISNVYIRRSQQRPQVRKIIHPKFIKAICRRANGRSKEAQKIIDATIKEIAERLTKFREEWRQSDVDIVDFVERLRESAGGLVPPPATTTPTSADPKKLTEQYLTAYIWRELELELARARRECSGIKDAKRRAELETLINKIHQELRKPAILSKPAQGNGRDAPESRPTWRDAVRTMGAPVAKSLSTMHELRRSTANPSQRNGAAARAAPAVRSPSAEKLIRGDLDLSFARLVNGFMSELRARKEDPSSQLIYILKYLAPIGRYVDEISSFRNSLESIYGDSFLHQHAHSFHVWLMGWWLLQSSTKEGRTLGDDVLALMTSCCLGPDARQLDDDMKRRLRNDWSSDGLGRDYLALYWGQLAAMHDVAMPIQALGALCRRFLGQYFGAGALLTDKRMLPSVLDIFVDPAFLVYKNAITGLYANRDRNWLDSVFYHGLSRHIDHSLAGALLLISELEPDSEYYQGGGIWQKAIDQLTGLVAADRPELGLFLPAYLAHAIAFSHLPDLCDDWQRIAPEQGDFPQRYLTSVATKFSVRFSEYPLTFLLALCDLLMEPHGDHRSKEDWVEFDDGHDRQLDGLSPFYPESVEVSGDEPPKITITLRIWRSHFSDEERIIGYKTDLGTLRSQFQWHAAECERSNSKPKATWHVIDYHRLRSYKEDPRLLNFQADPSKVNDQKDEPPKLLGSGIEWISYQRGDRPEYWLTRPAYEVIKLMVKIDRFNSSFVAEPKSWRFAVRLANVLSEVRNANKVAPPYVMRLGEVKSARTLAQSGSSF